MFSGAIKRDQWHKLKWKLKYIRINNEKLILSANPKTTSQLYDLSIKDGNCKIQTMNIKSIDKFNRSGCDVYDLISVFHFVHWFYKISSW